MAFNSTQKLTDYEGEVIYPGLQAIRFHDLRYTAFTTMAEKGLPEQTIMAQVGHISPQMMKTYSHIRRQALNAAAALQPAFLKQSPTQMPETINERIHLAQKRHRQQKRLLASVAFLFVFLRNSWLRSEDSNLRPFS